MPRTVARSASGARVLPPKGMLHSGKMERLEQIPIEGKRILVRTDYDTPLIDGKVSDDTRIRASLPTLINLLKRRARQVSVLCHIDRPGGKLVDDLRVAPVAKLLSSLLPGGAPVTVEENLRFNAGEETNDQGFARKLAAKGDVFVNDAFAVSHRKHASIVSLPKLLPSTIGLHFTSEIEALRMVREHPRRPVVFIIGGAKLETKLPLIEKLLPLADLMLIGGKLAQEVRNVCSPEMFSQMSVAQQTEDGKDITEEAAHDFVGKIKAAGTVVWNGPMGVFEEERTSLGTKLIAQAIDAANGYTVIGGGDTEAAATKFNAETGIDHISMGGGAMLQYLAEGTLVGLEAIKGGNQW